MDKIKIGIALSGGGVRGIVHIGVLAALQEHDIYPDVVSGASAGSLAGVYYCAGKSIDEMMEFVSNNSFFNMFSLGWPKGGLTGLGKLRRKLKKYVDQRTFAELERPLIVAVSNLNLGAVEYIESGELIDPIVASCTVPILFKPIVLNGQQYVDGGLLANTPVTPLLKKVDFTIAVNLIPRVTVENEDLNSLFGVAQRCFDLAALNNINPHLKKSDIIIEPKLLQNYSRFSTKNAQDLFQLGYDETIRMMDDIKLKIYIKTPPFIIG